MPGFVACNLSVAGLAPVNVTPSLAVVAQIGSSTLDGLTLPLVVPSYVLVVGVSAAAGLHVCGTRPLLSAGEGHGAGSEPMLLSFRLVLRPAAGYTAPQAAGVIIANLSAIT